MKRILPIVLLLPCNHANAYDLLVGASVGHRTITVSDKKRSSKQVSKFRTEGLSWAPHITLRTEPEYIWEDRNWSYTFSTDFYTSSFDKQVINNKRSYDHSLRDQGTEIKGLSLYVTPIIYYQFGRDNPDNWQYRAGFGAGIGYQNHEGEFYVNDRDHPNYGQVESIDHSGLAVSAGVYLEASYKRHHIIFNGDLIAANLSGSSYQYLENNVSIKYQYKIHSFAFDLLKIFE